MALLDLQIRQRREGFCLDISTQLPLTGFTVICGASGSGKTSMLRCIAGLDRVAEGRVSFAGKQWQEGRRFLPVHQRKIGYVFQEPSLFSHLTVRENLQFGLKRSDAESTDLSPHTATLDLLGLSSLLARPVAGLSLGEQQRVALARALVLQPDVLLMDEPLASLDAARKKEVLGLLEQVHQQSNIPCLYVTHSLDEAARLADYLVLLQDGKISSQGSVQKVFQSSQWFSLMAHAPFALGFAKVEAVQSEQHICWLNCQGARLAAPIADTAITPDIRVRVYARDVSLSLHKPEASSILNIVESKIVSQERWGEQGQQLVWLQSAEFYFCALVTEHSAQRLGLDVGKPVFAQIKAVSLSD